MIPSSPRTLPMRKWTKRSMTMSQMAMRKRMSMTGTASLLSYWMIPKMRTMQNNSAGLRAALLFFARAMVGENFFCFLYYLGFFLIIF